MTPTGQWERSGSRHVLLLAIALVMGWGLALIKQSQEYVPDAVNLPRSSDLEARRRSTLYYKPESLLEHVLRALSFRTERMDPTGAEPVDRNDVAVVLYPETQLPAAMSRELQSFVREGGRLVVFTDQPLDLLRGLGVEATGLPRSEDPAVLAAPGFTLEGQHVRTVTAPARASFSAPGTRIVPLLTSGKGVVAGLLGLGRGTLVVVGTRIADYDWIEKDDNVLFLSNLFFGHARGPLTPDRSLELSGPQALQGFQAGAPLPAAPARESADLTRPRVRILDYDAQVLARLYEIQRLEGLRQAEARRKWRYDSLWSLIRANPVSAALIQLALGLLVFAFSRSRRLGPALPAHVLADGLPDPVQTRGRLFEAHGTVRLAVARTGVHAHGWICRKLALSGGGELVTPEEIREALAQRPGQAKELYERLLKRISAICRKEETPEEMHVVMVWKDFERLKRELD